MNSENSIYNACIRPTSHMYQPRGVLKELETGVLPLFNNKKLIFSVIDDNPRFSRKEAKKTQKMTITTLVYGCNPSLQL